MDSTIYRHFSMTDLETALTGLGASPQDYGTLEMIVSRPVVGERLVMEQADLDTVDGLIGDNWRARGSTHTEDGSAEPGAQIAIMNSRAIQAITQDRTRWSIAGDQLFVDLDLSVENLRPGQRIAIGTAILEITEKPHNGCAKFTERFGHDAIRWVNSEEGRQARRRGIYTRVITPGTIRTGDKITKIETAN